MRLTHGQLAMLLGRQLTPVTGELVALVVVDLARTIGHAPQRLSYSSQLRAFVQSSYRFRWQRNIAVNDRVSCPMTFAQEAVQTGADVISDVLRSIRLAGTLYFEAQLSAPWGIRIVNSGYANFHQVTSGSCFLSVDDETWIELGQGETIVLPQGSTHTLCNEPGDETIDGQSLFERIDDDGVVRLGTQGPSATLLCGHFSYDRELNHPLLQALPPVIHGQAGRYPGWTNLAQLAVARSKGLEPAAQALTDRLAEVLLIELLSDLDQSQSGFVAALADPTVAAALHAIHDDPARDWTVASLADHVAASRSTLAARFTELVGETPIRYLTRWRMRQATQLLRDTTLPAFRIAELVGYGTPFSFTKAFTRELGMPPTRYRERTPTG